MSDFHLRSGPVCWNGPLTPEAIATRLLQEVDNVGVPVPVVFVMQGPPWLTERLTDYRPGERAFLGSVSRFGFSILIRTARPSVFSTICTGSIRRRPHGCEVRARFHYHPLVVFLFWTALLYGMVLFAFLFDTQPYPSREWWTYRLLAPLLLVLSAAGLV